MSIVYVAALPCRENPCKNGGTCITQADLKTYTCECPQPYHGTNCEEGKGTVSSTHEFLGKSASREDRPVFVMIIYLSCNSQWPSTD